MDEQEDEQEYVLPSARGTQRFRGARRVASLALGMAVAVAFSASALAQEVAPAPSPTPTILSAAPSSTIASLEALVAAARKSHPASRSSKERVKAAKEVPSRVSSLPDPVLLSSAQNFRFDNVGLGTHPMTGLVFGLSQGLPFPGKLKSRERVAEAYASLVSTSDLNLEENIELRVRRLYWQLHFAERAQVIVAENVKIVDMLTNVVHARFAVGQGAQQDATQAQVAHSALRADLAARDQAIVSARHALNEAVGRHADSPLAKTVAAPPRTPVASRTQLLSTAKTNNPRLAVARARTLLAKTKVTKAERDRLPDFMVGANYRARAAASGDSSGGADMISLTLGVTLPVWMGSKQDAAVREQGHNLLAARSSTEAESLSVETSVQLVVDVIERLDVQIKLYNDELLPESSLAVDASISDYQVGKVGFVSVLQNWRTNLNIQLQEEALLSRRSQALAELRTLVGANVLRSAQVLRNAQ